MINKNNIRLEDIDDKLFTKNDINGICVFYLNKACTLPFNGEIFSIFKDYIELEYEIRNGKKNGLEYIYYPTGKIEQINECRENVMFGVSKEYFQNGDLKTVSIVYNNYHIRIVEKVKSIFMETKSYDDKYGDKLPEYLQNLLKLSNSELVDYKFKEDNPYLNLDV